MYEIYVKIETKNDYDGARYRYLSDIVFQIDDTCVIITRINTQQICVEKRMAMIKITSALKRNEYKINEIRTVNDIDY